MARAATAAIYSSRPRVSLDGTLDQGLSAGVQTVVVEEDVSGLYCCDMTIGNWGTDGGNVSYLYFDRRALDFGKTIEVAFGQGDTAQKVFEGRITALEGRFLQDRAPEIAVLSEDKAQDLRMIRRSRTFEDVSDQDVIEQIASEHGLSSDVDIDGPANHRVLSQVNQTDLAFLRERARAVDAEMWLSGSTLSVHARSRRRHEDLVLTFGQRLKEFSVLADLAHQSTSMTVGGWDVQAKESLKPKADESAISQELDSGDTSGASVMSSAFGDRHQQVVHRVPLTDDEARHIVEAEFRRRARRFVTGRAMAEGDGRIRVGTRTQLKGLGPMFNGEYYVTAVKQLFDVALGYRTVFEVEKPGIGQ